MSQKYPHQRNVTGRALSDDDCTNLPQNQPTKRVQGVSHSFNVIGGKRALDAAWRSRARDLCRTCSCSAELQMCIKKAFEQVNRARLFDFAVSEGCPLCPILASMAACAWPRRLLRGSYAGRSIRPTRGVAAGSSLATFELELCLTDAARRLASGLPSLAQGAFNPSPTATRRVTPSLSRTFTSGSPLAKLSWLSQTPGSPKTSSDT